MYIFDTDHLSFIQRNGNEGKKILAKLATLQEPKVVVTVITYEEQVRGRLGVLTKARTIETQVTAYQGLYKLAADYQVIEILPFTHQAALEHQRLRKAYPRLGNMDLKIAAIAITNDALLLTRNKSDFGQIAELEIEDWTEGEV